MKTPTQKNEASRDAGAGEKGASARSLTSARPARDPWSEDFDCSFDGQEASEELSLLDEFERRHGPLDARLGR